LEEVANRRAKHAARENQMLKLGAELQRAGHLDLTASNVEAASAAASAAAAAAAAAAVYLWPVPVRQLLR
jgi:hypothetical protein